MSHTPSLGMLGAGSFGQLVLLYNYNDHAPLTIERLHDERLGAKDIARILNSTPEYAPLLGGVGTSVRAEGERLIFASRGADYPITCTTGSTMPPWLGQVEVLLECSGVRSKGADLCPSLTVGNTRLVVVSATCMDADVTLLYGFNHSEFDQKRHQTVSYGSCTVNAFVPLARWLNSEYGGVLRSQVNVVHDVPGYQLQAGFDTLKRHPCTLQQSAPNLLPFLSQANFHVDYTMVPYTGPSIINMNFQLGELADSPYVVTALQRAIAEGPLRGLYETVATDTGPEPYWLSPANAVIIEGGVTVRGNTLYIPCYFFNQGSGARYLDLVRYLLERVG